jgi:hypothetical protein
VAGSSGENQLYIQNTGSGISLQKSQLTERIPRSNIAAIAAGGYSSMVVESTYCLSRYTLNPIDD